MDHKRGDSFDYTAELPSSFADGYFSGWSLSSEVRRKSNNQLVSTLSASWVDPAKTRSIRLLALDTLSWPLEDMVFDVVLRRPSDGYRISTNTVSFSVVRGVTLS